METLDEVDEVELLLLYRPELARRIPWETDNPPVRLVVVNDSAPYYGHYGEICEVLRTAFLFPARAADLRADDVEENPETFVGIFDTRSAERMAEEFRHRVEAAQLPLGIRMEALDDDK